MNEEQQRLWSLLQDALPNVATQMRGSLSNLYTAVGRLLPPEELEQQPELTQSAAILNQSYYRLLRMVNNLSALAILKEHTPFPTANVELVGWLDELVLQAQPLAEMKGVDLRFSTPLRHHIAAVHREYLERMVWNLLSNALKFTPEGGRVSVGFALRPDRCSSRCRTPAAACRGRWRSWCSTAAFSRSCSIPRRTGWGWVCRCACISRRGTAAACCCTRRAGAAQRPSRRCPTGGRIS